MTSAVVAGGGGTQCIGASGPIMNSKDAPTAIVVVPSVEPSACKDGNEYPFKAIVFYGGRATSVRCFTQAHIDWYSKWAAAAQAHFDVLSVTPSVIANAITCPPPEMQATPEIQAAQATQDAAKLAILTDWMLKEYKPTSSPIGLRDAG